MKPEQLKRWEKIRSKGKSRYIWFNGVVLFGIFTAVFWSIIMEFIQPGETIFIRPIIALFLFPIGGYFWGIWTWKISEKKYLKTTRKNINIK